MKEGYVKVSALVTEAKEVEISQQTILWEASKHPSPSDVLRAAYHSWLKSRGVKSSDRMGKVYWEYYIDNGGHYSGWEDYEDKPVTEEDRKIDQIFTDLFGAISHKS